MPISNYSIPGVYVTQSGSALTSVNPTNLNIAIVADQAVSGTATDVFYGITGASGINIGTLSYPTAASGGASVTWVNPTGTTITGTYGRDYVFSTSGGITTITTSGVTGASVYPSGTVSVTYNHLWGAYGKYNSFTQLTNVIGPAVVSLSGSSAAVNPAVLAAQLAFQNGANTVTIMPVARISNGTTASDSDWANTFTAVGSGTNSNATMLASVPGVDVIVPIYPFTTSGNVQSSTSTVSAAISAYITKQTSNGIYQRFFIGVDGTTASVNATGVQSLATGFNNTRISLCFPALLNYNPGLNTSNGLTNATFNIGGQYMAAAVAGVFVGQPSVSTPVTNKQVYGFADIPSQISSVDAATNYLPYGILTVRKKRDGNFWVLHGLTTNVSTWLTQEISINAVGDVLANNIKSDLENSYLVGGPMTKNTLSAVLGTVQGTLTNTISSGLIQAYQNLGLSVNPAAPTTVNVTFQYAPTYPINYIQVVFSLNTQTGQVVYGNAQSNLVVY